MHNPGSVDIYQLVDRVGSFPYELIVAMGAAAGAGGIGYDMFMASNFYFDVREMSTITYMILVFSILLELMRDLLRKS